MPNNELPRCPKCGSPPATRRNGVVLDREWECRSSNYEDEGGFQQSPFCKLAVATRELTETKLEVTRLKEQREIAEKAADRAVVNATEKLDQNNKFIESEWEKTLRHTEGFEQQSGIIDVLEGEVWHQENENEKLVIQLTEARDKLAAVERECNQRNAYADARYELYEFQRRIKFILHQKASVNP